MPITLSIAGVNSAQGYACSESHRGTNQAQEVQGQGINTPVHSMAMHIKQLHAPDEIPKSHVGVYKQHYSPLPPPPVTEKLYMHAKTSWII